MPKLQPTARCDQFPEVDLGMSEAQLHAETERCLQCGVCSECYQCIEACRSVGALNHSEAPDESIEHAGVVIVADSQAVPPVRGEDVIRAYGTKATTTDVYAMMQRGFAAAAQAMIMLGGTAQRQRGHGLSFSPPDPQLADDVNLGVFVCRCNDALGWHPRFDEYLEALTDRPQVAHAEALPSACTPEGHAAILRTIRGKGLTRAALASCVCCPLDFICSACTDQRTRLKRGLFSGTGVSRAMVETSNLRGEVLRLLPHDEDAAVDRFRGFIDRSINRATRLKALPAPVRPYNFTTAVIGDSEAAITSAMTLAELGMEVFLFGGPGKPLSQPPFHPNVTSFEGSWVTGLGGTLGDFHVFVAGGNGRNEFQVGAVILGEKSRKRFPYVTSEGLPTQTIASAMQRRGVAGIPFFYPGATSISGLFLADPPGIKVSQRTKGTAAAILAASVMPRGPRQNKGYTVVVDEELCRGCGRCLQVCPYHAIAFRKNAVGGWCSMVDEALCKGCGNCISVCPSNAADSPYRDQVNLEQMIAEILT
jgi:ferredoxin